MENKKMTQREFFNGVLEVEGMPQELIDFANGRLAQMDKENQAKREKQKSKSVVRTEEDIAQMQEIKDYLVGQDTSVTVKTITNFFNERGIEVKAQKIGGLLKKMVNDEIVEIVTPDKRSAPLEYKLK